MINFCLNKTNFIFFKEKGRTRGVAQVVESLPSKPEFKPRTTTKKKKEKEKVNKNKNLKREKVSTGKQI
jgi:hypothetical protein